MARIGDTAFLAAGFALALPGGALAFWLLQDRSLYEALPNHLRIAALIPLVWGVALMCVPSLRRTDAEADPMALKGWAVAGAAVLLPLASLAWWLLSPGSHG